LNKTEVRFPNLDNFIDCPVPDCDKGEIVVDGIAIETCEECEGRGYKWNRERDAWIKQLKALLAGEN